VCVCTSRLLLCVAAHRLMLILFYYSNGAGGNNNLRDRAIYGGRSGGSINREAVCFLRSCGRSES
jgi:hypothetical protein